ncbi:MAG: flavodoxin domain-containing protein [Dehalococcoidales bacterium]|nr:flavodoxin domain-containing protein [Dehalococcoidales bacterium]
MKCIVIYFSQTGNTEKIARAIQTGIMSITGHCDLVSIKDANPRRLYDYDLIGLGSLVIIKEPPNVTGFINNLSFLGEKHAFSFCTHGAMGFMFNPSVVAQLKKKGLIVVGWNDWYGSGWALDMPTPGPTDGHPDKIDLEEAENWGRQMVWRSQRIYAGETDLIPQEPTPISLPEFGDDSSVRDLRYKEILRYDRTRCVYPRCRLCMDNCPMNGIDLTLDPPIIAKPCMNCGFCLMICPTGSINVDEKKMELLCQWIREDMRRWDPPRLKEAEARGQFRRLIPEDKIGWDTPVYKVYNHHPAFIIGKGRP